MEPFRPPERITDSLRHTRPGEEVLVAVGLDLDHERKTYRTEWLVVTGEHLLLLGDNGTEFRAHPLAAVDKLTITGHVGSNYLVAEAAPADPDGPRERTELCAFTDGRKTQVDCVVDWVNRKVKGEDLPDLVEKLRRTACARCARPVPEGLNKCPRCTDRRAVFRRIGFFLQPHRGRVALVFLFMIMAAAAGLVTPYLSKLFIDVILKPNAAGGFAHATWLAPTCLALLASYVGQFGIQALAERISGILGFTIVAEVRAKLFDKLQRLSLGFFDRQQTGSLIHRVNQDTGELRNLLVDFLPITLESALMFVGIGCLLFVLSWRLTLFVLIPIVGVVLFVKLVFPHIHHLVHRFFHRRSRLSSFVGDSLAGIRVIKAFGKEDAEVSKFDRANADLRRSGIELVKRFSLIHPVFHILIMSGMVIVWYAGGRLVLADRMSIGSVVAYTGYLMMFYRPVFILTRMVDLLTSSLGATERVFDIIDLEPEIRDAPDAQPLAGMAESLSFDHVTFGYDRYKPVIKDMTVTIAAREMIGLVGKSGAGKSTFINLVCRLYDVDQGAIRIDGVDLRKIRQDDLRANIGIVLQETYLFDGSLYENIAYGRPTATAEEVIAAAITANAHEFIMQKPDGYDTEVGERGIKLSGGEKQRIAIARAVLKDPALLILDEATSSVDTSTEHKIQEALRHLVQGRTTIAIAHRLSTLRTCDRLIVIDDGEIAEVGTHQELMAHQGIFYDLVQKQQEMSAIMGVEG